MSIYVMAGKNRPPAARESSPLLLLVDDEHDAPTPAIMAWNSPDLFSSLPEMAARGGAGESRKYVIVNGNVALMEPPAYLARKSVMRASIIGDAIYCLGAQMS